jgi:hypothetical protein
VYVPSIIKGRLPSLAVDYVGAKHGLIAQVVRKKDVFLYGALNKYAGRTETLRLRFTEGPFEGPGEKKIKVKISFESLSSGGKG